MHFIILKFSGSIKHILGIICKAFLIKNPGSVKSKLYEFSLDKLNKINAHLFAFLIDDILLLLN